MLAVNKRPTGKGRAGRNRSSNQSGTPSTRHEFHRGSGSLTEHGNCSLSVFGRGAAYAGVVAKPQNLKIR